MSTIDRFIQWVEWWREAGALEGDGGPRRPRDVTAEHDRELGRAARIVARVQRERGL